MTPFSKMPALKHVDWDLLVRSQVDSSAGFDCHFIPIGSFTYLHNHTG